MDLEYNSDNSEDRNYINSYLDTDGYVYIRDGYMSDDNYQNKDDYFQLNIEGIDYQLSKEYYNSSLADNRKFLIITDDGLKMVNEYTFDLFKKNKDSRTTVNKLNRKERRKMNRGAK